MLRSTIVGCVLTCGEGVHGAVEGWDTVEAGRAALAELGFWLDRLEEIGEEQRPEGWTDIEEEGSSATAV